MRAYWLLLALPQWATALTLDPDGSQPPIVVAPDATVAERTAAEELAEHLQVVYHKPVRQIPEAAVDEPAIYVGQTAAARRLGLVPDGPEAWRMTLRDGSLYLTGGRPRGTLYAVWHFLEDVLQARWYTPHFTVLPASRPWTIEALDRSGEPAFSYRDIYAEFQTPSRFAARNRLNGHFAGLKADWGGTVEYGPPYHVHTLFTYLPPEQYFKDHPEWYSEVGGQRKDGQTQLCLTNQQVIDEITKRLRTYIESSRQKALAAGEEPPHLFGISQNDWGGACECVNCTAVVKREGGQAGPLIQFVNAIADAIATDYPDVLLDTLAYQHTLLPPTHLKPRDNVVIRLCHLSGSDFAKPWSHPDNQQFHDAVIAWSKITKHLRIWDYAVTYGDTPGLPFASLRTMPADYRFLTEHGVEGLFIEHEYPVHADLRDLKLWVQMTLLEDPSQDLASLVKDFTDGYYGAAGPMVREYLAALETAAEAKPSYVTGWTTPDGYRYLDLEFLTKAEAIFDRAEAAVADDALRREPVRLARLPVDRAIAAKWSALCREHAVAGGTAENLPFDLRGTILPRIRETVTKAAEERLSASQRLATIAKLTGGLDAIAAVNPFAPLPARFADVPRERLTDLGPDSFRRWKNTCKLVPDPTSDTGMVARLDLTAADVEQAERYRMLPDSPMPFGVYDTKAKKGITSQSIKPVDVTGPGYRWYTIKDVTIGPGCYLYLWWSWIIQVDLDSALGAGETTTCDVHVQLKLTGPWFPHGQADEPNTIDVQRVIVVRHP